jgi:hypothetical protein
MAITKQIGPRSIILQETEAEIATLQTISARYDWVLNGEATLPVESEVDGRLHVEAEFVIHQIRITARIAGTSQYRVKVISKDINGANEIIHCNQTTTLDADSKILNVPMIDALVPENRTLILTLKEEVVGSPAYDITVSAVSEEFAITEPTRGHVINNSTGAAMPQEPVIEFSEVFELTDTAGEKTNIDVPDIDVIKNQNLLINGNKSFSGTTTFNFHGENRDLFILQDGGGDAYRYDAGNAEHEFTGDFSINGDDIPSQINSLQTQLNNKLAVGNVAPDNVTVEVVGGILSVKDDALGQQADFTPQIRDSSAHYSITPPYHAKYFKIGNLVFITIRFVDIDLTGLSSSSPLWIQHNLPFTPAVEAVGEFRTSYVSTNGENSPYSLLLPGYSYISLETHRLLGSTGYSVADFTSGSSNILISMTFIAN